MPAHSEVDVSAATGLGVLDLAVLEACERLGATPDRPYLKSARILDEVYAATGIGPRVAYEPLCDLARPWQLHLLLIDFHGNFGSPDFDAAGSRYTEARLTPFGVAALAAERGEIGPLPIGLINGNLHAGGRRPPLDPHRVIAALRAASENPSTDLAALVGPPEFPTGCEVEVADPTALAAGDRTTLALSARLHLERSDLLIVSCLPPGSSVGEIGERLNAIHARWHNSLGAPDEEAIRYVVDFHDSTTEHGSRFEIHLAGDSDTDAVSALLRRMPGIRRTIDVAFGQAVQSRVEEIAGHAGDDLSDRLRTLSAAVRADP